MNIIAFAFALPYWMYLQILRPWRMKVNAQHLAKFMLEPFFWVNNLWASVPLLFIQKVVQGKITWLWAIMAYLFVGILLHSSISSATKLTFNRWISIANNHKSQC